MSFHRPTRLQLAVHEAGHAYALAAHEVEASGLDGCSNRRTGRASWMVGASDGAEPGNPVPELGAATLHEFEWEADVEMAILIAGPLAEFRHRHRSRFGAAFLCIQNADRFLKPDAFDTDGDFHTIRAIMADMSTLDPEGRLRTVIGIADLALAKKWPSVERLSRNLL